MRGVHESTVVMPFRAVSGVEASAGSRHELDAEQIGEPSLPAGRCIEVCAQPFCRGLPIDQDTGLLSMAISHM